MTHFAVQQKLKMTLQINYTSIFFFFFQFLRGHQSALTKHLGGLTTEICFVTVWRPEAEIAGLEGWFLLKAEKEQSAPGPSLSILRPQLSSVCGCLLPVSSVPFPLYTPVSGPTFPHFLRSPDTTRAA